jgi:hypothetical protein
MKILARAIVDALAYLHTAPEGSVSPEAADEAMELIAAHLQNCTPEEREAVLEVVREDYRLHNEASAEEEVIDFYENFEESFFGEDEGE